MGFHWSEFVEQRVKVHLLDEGYVWVPKGKDFDEDLKEEIRGKSKFSGLRGVLRTSYRFSTLKEVGILSTLVLVSIFLLILGLKWWNVLRVCLGRKMPKTRCSLPRRSVHQGEGVRLVEGNVFLGKG